jgi:hypothetical protein
MARIIQKSRHGILTNKTPADRVGVCEVAGFGGGYSRLRRLQVVSAPLCSTTTWLQASTGKPATGCAGSWSMSRFALCDPRSRPERRKVAPNNPNEHAAVLDNFSSSPQMMHSWFINIACSRQVPPRRVNRSAPRERILRISFPLRLMQAVHEQGRRKRRSPCFPSCRTGTDFTCHYQGVSHAEWPKNNDEHASPQIGETVF